MDNVGEMSIKDINQQFVNLKKDTTDLLLDWMNSGYSLEQKIKLKELMYTHYFQTTEIEEYMNQTQGIIREYKKSIMAFLEEMDNIKLEEDM